MFLLHLKSESPSDDNDQLLPLDSKTFRLDFASLKGIYNTISGSEHFTASSGLADRPFESWVSDTSVTMQVFESTRQ